MSNLISRAVCYFLFTSITKKTRHTHYLSEEELYEMVLYSALKYIPGKFTTMTEFIQYYFDNLRECNKRIKWNEIDIIINMQRHYTGAWSKKHFYDKVNRSHKGELTDSDEEEIEMAITYEMPIIANMTNEEAMKYLRPKFVNKLSFDVSKLRMYQFSLSCFKNLHKLWDANGGMFLMNFVAFGGDMNKYENYNGKDETVYAVVDAEIVQEPTTDVSEREPIVPERVVTYPERPLNTLSDSTQDNFIAFNCYFESEE